MSIREFLLNIAGAKAAHDGVPVSAVHLHGTASDLIAEVRRALDAAVAGVRPAGAAVAAEVSAVASGGAAGETEAADAPAVEAASAPPAAAPDAPASDAPSESVS